MTTLRVALVDVLLPGVSGIGIARELLRDDPNRRVLALSMVADEAHVADALQAGVLGYACKSQSAAEVMDAIRTVARGETYLAPQVSGFVVSDYRRLRNGAEGARSPLATLTAREREIFELCIQGNPTAQIARQLCISPRTVETHRGRILRKLNAHAAVAMRVLVTGGAGYVGSGVVEELVRVGHSAIVYDSLYKGHREAVHPDAEFVHADLFDAAALRGALGKTDAVIHMAADALVGESVR